MSGTANHTSQWLKLTKVCFLFQIGLSVFSGPCHHSETQEPYQGAATTPACPIAVLLAKGKKAVVGLTSAINALALT